MALGWALVLGSLAVAPQPPRIVLRNGVQMPMLLFGTPSCGSSAACKTGAQAAASEALDVGFAGIDTANHYETQAAVRAAVAASSRPSSAVWITTKIEACNNSFVRLGHCNSDTKAVFEQNLAELGVNATDLTLLHAPTSTGGGSIVYPGFSGSPSCDCAAPAACAAMQQQWAALEEMYRANKSRAIGVSNYCPACLECIAKTATIAPHVNQLLIHVGMGPDPKGLLSYCTSRGIAPQAYSPLGTGSAAVLKANITNSIGKEHGVSSAQVALRWLAQHKIPMVTSASADQVAYMEEDIAIFNWTLTNHDMAALDAATFSLPATSPVKFMCLE